ncbi:ABC transporter ATP-binding protein [Acetobacterium sp.]|jgi:peptide/nickel transport system ATP-binding protein|uniref:ABC transporter ATP-binding protein n=1 Tax=Acetobacterium sp. TaxID=1872094 RepID=UPI000CBCDF7D|nr:ABC transporter ATP-binding protein [Acetobacterium sp.]MDO9491552.1 ABC transporter ATP-binding protein [Acetobacterium sp.]PKM74675.1 MAG: ABC transporter ATP-binding protein [Firmicutes bacterium HGW-Firmicutes-17]
MDAVLEVRHLKKTYKKGKNLINAVEDISFEVQKGECLGLVGESGSGKSTLAKMITGLEPADQGDILLNGKTITGLNGKAQRAVYRDIQMVFQMPADSFNPRIKLGEGIMESMINQGVARNEAKTRAQEYLKICGLSPEFADRYPYQVSGGECQRASIARAIAINPQLLICDEATSALDVTVQAQIVKLLAQFKKKSGMAQLMICHDLALVQEVCDRVLVMHNGRVVEEGTPDQIIMHPREAYTQKLIESIF